MLRHGAMTSTARCATMKTSKGSMKIYFAGSTQSLNSQLATYRHIARYLKKQQATMLDTWVVATMKGRAANSDSRVLLHREQALLQQADAVVAEVSTPSLGVGAMLMFAVEQHKPTLCLYPDTADEADISESVKGLTSSLVTTATYNNTTLERILTDFLQQARDEQFQKFNFIANKKISDFIERQARREHKTKSEFLRDFINAYIDDYHERYVKEEIRK